MSKVKNSSLYEVEIKEIQKVQTKMSEILPSMIKAHIHTQIGCTLTRAPGPPEQEGQTGVLGTYPSVNPPAGNRQSRKTVLQHEAQERYPKKQHPKQGNDARFHFRVT